MDKEGDTIALAVQEEKGEHKQQKVSERNRSNSRDKKREEGTSRHHSSRHNEHSSSHRHHRHHKKSRSRSSSSRRDSRRDRHHHRHDKDRRERSHKDDHRRRHRSSSSEKSKDNSRNNDNKSGKENSNRGKSDDNRAKHEQANETRGKFTADDLAVKRPEDFEQGTLRASGAAPVQKGAMMPARAGGVYIPPFRLKAMMKELETQDQNTEEKQKFMWEMLRKSINGIINKVNVSNIQNIILELFNENLLRGKGLLCRAIMKAQMASPGFTHVYAALIAVINTKLPEIVKLIIHRVIIQFQLAFKRNNKIVCMAVTKMIAHMINQQIVHELLALELLALLLETPTEDSVEIAADFMIECGQVLGDITPAGANAIFERFRSILHEGEIDKKVQYTIENLFAVRKSRFAQHPGVIQELDLVENEDKITHDITLEDQLEPENECNQFRFDPNYEQTEGEWDEIKKEILGEEEDHRMKRGAGIVRAEGDQSEDEDEEEQKNLNEIEDISEKDLVNLRRTIYLVIMSSVDFEECCHKLLKLNIRAGQEMELCNMIFECCIQERTYLRFYGLLAQRFCLLNEIYGPKYHELFMQQYVTIHRLDVNKISNAAKFFSHMFNTDAIEWSCLSAIRLVEEETTASSRIFIKIFFQDLTMNLGMENLKKKFADDSLKPYLEGIFPKDSVEHARFSINFFTSIGLGAVTEDLREFLKAAPKLLLEKKYAELLAQAEAESSSSDSSSSDDSSDSSSSSDSDSSEDERRKKEKKSTRK